MSAMVQKLRSSIYNRSYDEDSNKGLFAFDDDLNAWVRVEAHAHDGNLMNKDEVVVTDKKQSDLWFAW